MINFGSQLNKFEFYDNSLFAGFKDSLSFQSPIHITNLNRLDIVYSNQDLDIHWIGGSLSGKVQISIKTSRLQDNYISNGETTGINIFMNPNSNGTLTLPHQLLQQLSTTHAIGNFFDIMLATAEPKTITTPNNKTITVLGVSQHKVTVVLKH